MNVVGIRSRIWQRTVRRRTRASKVVVNRCMKSIGVMREMANGCEQFSVSISVHMHNDYKYNNNKRLIRQRHQSESALCWLCRCLFSFLFFVCELELDVRICVHTLARAMEMKCRRAIYFDFVFVVFVDFADLDPQIHHHGHHHLLCIVPHTLLYFNLCLCVCEVECRRIHISEMALIGRPAANGFCFFFFLLCTNIKLSHSLFTIGDGDSTSTRFEAVFISKQIDEWNMRRSRAPANKSAVRRTSHTKQQ